MQQIVVYIIIAVAVLYGVVRSVRAIRGRDDGDDSGCSGGDCSGCSSKPKGGCCGERES